MGIQPSMEKAMETHPPPAVPFAPPSWRHRPRQRRAKLQWVPCTYGHGHTQRMIALLLVARRLDLPLTAGDIRLRISALDKASPLKEFVGFPLVLTKHRGLASSLAVDRHLISVHVLSAVEIVSPAVGSRPLLVTRARGLVGGAATQTASQRALMPCILSACLHRGGVGVH